MVLAKTFRITQNNWHSKMGKKWEKSWKNLQVKKEEKEKKLQLS